jgi:hypothetical protein
MCLDPDQSVDAAIKAHPALMHVLIREHMSCVGCPLVTFCSLDYAAVMHGKTLADLDRRLNTQGQPS